MVLGVVQQDGPRPVVEYLNARVPATPEILAMAAPLKPTEVFRLAATCAEHKCPHFDGADCRLANGGRQFRLGERRHLDPRGDSGQGTFGHGTISH